MTSRRDDDALSWAGDDDPTLDAGESPTLREGWAPVGGSGSIVGTGESAADDERANAADDDSAQLSSAMLVVFGVLGGIYLLYAIGWAVVATRIGTDATDAVGPIMFAIGNWLAVLAVPLWFLVTLWLTPDAPRTRLLWLIGGAVLLVPLPFILGTGVAL